MNKVIIKCKGYKTVKLSALEEFQGNLKQLSKDSYQKLKNNLLKNGFKEPFTIWEHKNHTYIINGHQRKTALLKMQEEKITIPAQFPCNPIQAKTKKEAKEAVLALTSQYGEITDKGLHEFMQEIGLKMDDLTSTFRFPEINFDDFKADFYPDKLPDGADDVPEPPKKAKSKLGELYILGTHRLLAGDATKKDDVERLMDGKKADMVFTDPPYSVNYGADQDTLNKKSGNKFRLIARPIAGDNLTVEECASKLWSPSFKSLFDFSKDDCSFYMTMCQGGDQMMMMMMMMKEHWQIKHELIWVKSSPVFSMGRLDYDYQHEPILFGWKKKHNFYGKGEFLKSVWAIPKPSKSDLHPTMKPIALIVNAIQNSSKKDDLVLDLFLGSGSTLIACEQTKRICYGMEIDPIYIDVILDRWEKFTGKQATREDGKKWREIKNRK